MLKDVFNKYKPPTITKKKILTTFTTKEKKKNIIIALNELVKNGKVLRLIKTNANSKLNLKLFKTINYMINPEEIKINVVVL
jgi:predicted type IV restriction endonuclease